MNTKQIERNGNTLTITKQVSALISFEDILKKVEVKSDYDYDFFDCDGLEHEVISFDKFAYNASYNSSGYEDTNISESIRDARGYFWRDGWREYSFILIDKDKARRDGWGMGYSTGASKQVLSESLACGIRQTTDYIRKIYTDEVHAYGIVCDFTAPDGEEYSDSCWGFESEEYCEGVSYEDCRDSYIKSEIENIALEVAAQLEKAGYTITDKPKGAPYSALSRYKNRGEYSGVNAQNWRGEVQDVYTAKSRHNRRHNKRNNKRAN